MTDPLLGKCACPECETTVIVNDWDNLQMCDVCNEDLVCLRQTVRSLRGGNPLPLAPMAHHKAMEDDRAIELASVSGEP